MMLLTSWKEAHSISNNKLRGMTNEARSGRLLLEPSTSFTSACDHHDQTSLHTVGMRANHAWRCMSWKSQSSIEKEWVELISIVVVMVTLVNDQFVVWYRHRVHGQSHRSSSNKLCGMTFLSFDNTSNDAISGRRYGLRPACPLRCSLSLYFLSQKLRDITAVSRVMCAMSGALEQCVLCNINIGTS